MLSKWLNKKKVKFGLALKITVLVVALVVLIMGIVSYFSIYQGEKLKRQEMDKRMADVANMVAALKLIEPLAGEKVADPIFREFIKVVRNLDSNIISITIIDNMGTVKAYAMNPNTAITLDPSLEGIQEDLASLETLQKHKFKGGLSAKISGDIIVEGERVSKVILRFSLLSLKREIMMLKIRNLLVTFFMIILGCAAAFWLAKTVIKPIGVLTEAMAKVAKGNLNVTAPVMAKDEIGNLTENFNSMVQDLREKVRIKDAFDVVADELKDVEKVKEAFQLYVNKQVQERFLDTTALSMQTKEEDRRPVTLLFADLTYLVQGTTTQDMLSLSGVLDKYFRKFMSTIFEYEGQVYKFQDNLFIVAFGVLDQHPDDDRRAMLTAVTMQKALAEINKEQVKKNEPPLYVALGVASGEALGSFVTPRGLSPLEVIRDYIDFTRKINNNQPFSGIMVAGNIFRGVTNVVRGEKVEELQLPDTGENMEVYRITGAKF